MPVYEYECENCGARFERVQSFRDEPIRQCPECSGTVHKVFHPAGIIFKGSGWYITDSRKSTTGTVTGETKPSTDAKNGSAATGADPKPEKTTPATESKNGTSTSSGETKAEKTETK